MKFLKRCRAEIDLDALDFNLRSIREKCPNKEIIAVVKANAYGHSDEICSKEYYRLGIRRYAVSNILEGERIRGFIGDKDCFILIFGYIPEENFDEILRGGFTVTLGSVEFAERLNAFAASRGAKIQAHIALDTGMTRVGLRDEREINSVMRLKNLEITGVYSHLCVGDMLDESDLDFTRKQYEKLLLLTKGTGLPIHFQNSGGIAFHSDLEADYIRPGLILYGLSANPDEKPTLPLKQVMTLKSVIDQIKDVPKGTEIGYGRTYETDRRQLIAVVPIGYADGCSRLLSNKGKLIVNGVACPIRGRICMDQMMIDVSQANAKLGDEAIVYSGDYEETDLNNIARSIGTITNEVVCGVSARVPRIAVRNASRG